MRIASRYFATVRRAISIPSDLRISTIRSSERMPSGGSPSIRALIRNLTASAECAASPSVPGDGSGKEILKLERAARGRDIFVRRHAADGALVHLDRLGDIAQDQRPQMAPRRSRMKPLLLADDFSRPFRIVLRALLQRKSTSQFATRGARQGQPGPPCRAPRGCPRA